MGMWVCLHDPLTPVWKYSLLQVFSAGQFRKGLESFLSRCPASQVCPLSTVIHTDINAMGWVSLALMKSHFMTKKSLLKVSWGHHLGLSYWTSEKDQVGIRVFASSWGQGKVPLLSGPADIPERAVESVFWATASLQNGIAYFIDWGSNEMHTCILWGGILSLLKIFRIYLQNSPPRAFSFLPKWTGERTFTFYSLLVEYEKT